MESGEQINITVLLSGRPYPISIDASEEQVIRQLAKELNEKIHQLQLKYARIDKQDAMAMTLLIYARELAMAQKKAATLAKTSTLDALKKETERPNSEPFPE